MPKDIPDAPVFRKITVCGVPHTVTPGPWSLNRFVGIALVVAGYKDWHDCGVSGGVEEAFEKAIPMPTCPVETEVSWEDEDGDVFTNPRFQSGDTPDTVPPEDRLDFLLYQEWQARLSAWYNARHGVRESAEAYGELIRKQMIARVVRELEKEWPFFVPWTVGEHLKVCRHPRGCCRDEHYAAELIGRLNLGPEDAGDQPHAG